MPPPAPTTTATTIPAGSPTAVADAVSAEEDKDVRIFVLGNDGAGSAPLDEGTLEIVAGPLHADAFRVHDDHLHYRSVKDYEGTDTLRYRICNDDGLCDEAMVTITVER